MTTEKVSIPNPERVHPPLAAARRRADSLATERDGLLALSLKSHAALDSGRPNPLPPGRERDRAILRLRNLGGELAGAALDAAAERRTAGSLAATALLGQRDYRAILQAAVTAWASQLEPLAQLAVTNHDALLGGVSIPARFRLPPAAVAQLGDFAAWVARLATWWTPRSCRPRAGAW